MNFLRIDKDTIKEVSETIIDLKPLRARLVEIDEEIKNWEEQPDEMTIINEQKKSMLEILSQEKKSIELKLNIK